RRRHTRSKRDWSSDVCSSDLAMTVFTLIVQSSSATIGILQGLYAENLVDLKAALPILFGDNIGTTITAVIASIGASVAARRAAEIGRASCRERVWSREVA